MNLPHCDECLDIELFFLYHTKYNLIKSYLEVVAFPNADSDCNYSMLQIPQ